MSEEGTPRRRVKTSLTGYPLVEVKWVDSSETVPNEELTEAELPVPHIKYNAGYLIHDTTEFIVVAAGCNEHGTYEYAIAIPRLAILDERRRTR